MSATELAEVETQAAEHSHRVLDLIDAGRREELASYLSGLSRDDLAWMNLALASALLRQEAETDDLEVRNGILRRQNETLEAGNARLFRERTVLREKLEEWRQMGRAA